MISTCWEDPTEFRNDWVTPEASDAEMVEACRKTGIYSILRKNAPDDPLGGVVTAGGDNFSGGQRRLLATTRALLRRPWVMFFDEPTTGIDAQSIRNIIQPLFDRLKTTATIVLVDHNMNFVRHTADYVLALENGAVAGHDETERLWRQKESLFRVFWDAYNRETRVTDLKWCHARQKTGEEILPRKESK